MVMMTMVAMMMMVVVMLLWLTGGTDGGEVGTVHLINSTSVLLLSLNWWQQSYFHKKQFRRKS